MAVFTKSPPLFSHIKALLLFSVLFGNIHALLTSVDCRWPDGTDSNGRIPCNPDAERSACCLGTEVCLENNLCFGGVGLFYRSACAGGWGDNETCPEFCNDLLPDTWANIWPCPGLGTEGPTLFWCGNGRVCDSSVLGDSSFFAIENYKFQANSIIGGPAAATTASVSASASATATASLTTVPSTAFPTTCPEGDDRQAVVVGAGVGVPLALLALALGIWAVVERRKRIHNVDYVASAGVHAGILGKGAEKAELVRNHKQGTVLAYDPLPNKAPTETIRIPTPRGMNFNDGISHDTRHLTHPKAKRARFPESKVQDDKIYTLPRAQLSDREFHHTENSTFMVQRPYVNNKKATTVSRSATKFGVNHGRQCQPPIPKPHTLCSGMPVVAKIFSREKAARLDGR
ncbi:hypothetical protein EPUS_04912 [Endocarpon pusillum Z07020]|uniref:Uncharacterized protein n=1 Tax=Endocarpon pusillum (strain Z07020 / HMAS-L-300199) TaxID=1263415 RepID=U1GQX6_ENDPU|nr:uncharacterized protein EPUS_04912 [Endocarpon pusillum Z07020]ERF74743.1 hypothetical protein EPUS_04912 [Endocarpon pusillum Z07020]